MDIPVDCFNTCYSCGKESKSRDELNKRIAFIPEENFDRLTGETYHIDKYTRSIKEEQESIKTKYPDYYNNVVRINRPGIELWYCHQ